MYCLHLSPAVVVAEEESAFIVTAYYSPLPDQEYYITWTYEGDIRLNGQWIAGASWKKVFSGMLAAPAGYSFGTKIYLEGLWIGSVEDRGWAIVPAGQRGYSHDRIDIWMGYGDEGLRRANFWGKRKVRWYISTSQKITLDYTSIPAPKWATHNLIKTQNNVKEDIFSKSLWKGSDTAAILELQNILVQLEYLEEWNYIAWEYDSATISAIFDIQVQNWVLSASSDLGAGYFGPQTRSTLKELYELYLKREAEKAIQKELEEKYLQEARKEIESLWDPKFWDVSAQVRNLQNILSQLWYFQYKDTAIFGEITRSAILEFQMNTDLIQVPEDIGAGIFWPKTKQALIDAYWDYLLLLQSK
jgi:peptidoglycan hydrolase-like protein with peptidoglycan-binding domain